MSTANTLMHRELFEGLVAAADQRDRSGDDVALAILYAALAVARNRLGDDVTRASATTFLSRHTHGR